MKTFGLALFGLFLLLTLYYKHVVGDMTQALWCLGYAILVQNALNHREDWNESHSR